MGAAVATWKLIALRKSTEPATRMKGNPNQTMLGISYVGPRSCRSAEPRAPLSARRSLALHYQFARENSKADFNTKITKEHEGWNLTSCRTG